LAFPQPRPSSLLQRLTKSKVYISKPNDYPHQPSKLLLFLTGGTGILSVNNQLQADKFASEGFLVVMPDMFDNDPAPNSTTSIEEENATVIEQIKLGFATAAKSFTIDMWLARHTAEKVMPILLKVIDAAKIEFADAVAGGGGIYGVGYCFGAKYIIVLAGEKSETVAWSRKPNDEEAGVVKNGPYIKVGAIAHGTLVTKDDFHGLKSPILLLCVENDQLFPEEILNDGIKYLQENGVEHGIKTYPGVPHGKFALIF
jgi:dienelactone hydrolase